MDLLCLDELCIHVEQVAVKWEKVEKIGKLSAIASADNKFYLLGRIGVVLTNISFNSIIHFGPEPQSKRGVLFTNQVHDIHRWLFCTFFLNFRQRLNDKRATAILDICIINSLANIKEVTLIILNPPKDKKLIIRSLRMYLITWTPNPGMNKNLLMLLNL